MNTNNHQFNNLTPAEAERLFCLLEELGETQQIIGKILRHGYESYNPFDEDKVINRKLLEKEIGDIVTVLDMMFEAEDINSDSVEENSYDKHESIKKYLHHN